MWTTRGLRIVPFLNEFVQVAREDGYEYVLLLVARPADDYLLFEKLFQDWTSIHHLTGTEIMFLFVGPNTAREEKPPGFLARNRLREEELFFSPHVGISNAGESPKRTRYPSRMRNGQDYARLTEHVASFQEFDEIANSHESQVKELRKRFSLTEAELPALILLCLHGYQELQISIRGVVSLYGLLKSVVDEIETCAILKRRLREVTLALHRLRQSSDYRFSKKYQGALDALSSASQQESTVLKGLQAALEDPFPWNRQLKSTTLHSILHAIKGDPDAAWFYRKHRGNIQSIVHTLQLANSKYFSPDLFNENALKGLINEQQNLKNQDFELTNTALDRALQNHSREEYRSSTNNAENKIEAPDVFISYSRADIEKASLIEDFLKKNGYDVWRDDAVRAGYSFRAEIRAALLSAKSIIVLWTTNSINSEWVEWEASMAHRRKRLIPVSDGTVRPHHLPAPFGNLQLLDLSETEKILTSIRTTIAVSAA